MSFRQIFDRIARIARSQSGDIFDRGGSSDLRRAQELIDEARRRDEGEVETPDPETVRLQAVYAAAARILGVTPAATVEQVTQAYRQRARDYHPDRFAHASADEQRNATLRMQELNLAYDLLVRRARR